MGKPVPFSGTVDEQHVAALGLPAIASWTAPDEVFPLDRASEAWLRQKRGDVSGRAVIALR